MVCLSGTELKGIETKAESVRRLAVNNHVPLPTREFHARMEQVASWLQAGEQRRCPLTDCITGVFDATPQPPKSCCSACGVHLGLAAPALVLQL